LRLINAGAWKIMDGNSGWAELTSGQPRNSSPTSPMLFFCSARLGAGERAFVQYDYTTHTILPAVILYCTVNGIPVTITNHTTTANTCIQPHPPNSRQNIQIHYNNWTIPSSLHRMPFGLLLTIGDNCPESIAITTTHTHTHPAPCTLQSEKFPPRARPARSCAFDSLTPGRNIVIVN
jgi:hypothetical protein